jgi:hypothetical protein
MSQALVVHACNPNYSGGRDQEDHSSRPARENRSLYLKNTQLKKELAEWLKWWRTA